MADKLEAASRSHFGKGASRRLRRDGRVPAVIYGHGADPVHVSVDAHEIFLATKGQANPILTVVVDGRDQLVLVKELQRNPSRGPSSTSTCSAWPPARKSKSKCPSR